MGLIPDKSVDAIPLGESTDQAGLVLPHAFDQVGRDSDVQGPVSGAGENVDVGGSWRRPAGVSQAQLTVIPASEPESRGVGDVGSLAPVLSLWVPAFAGMTKKGARE